MQVMGGVARECGFAGEFHTELLDPATGIRHGCLYLAKCLRRWGTVDRAIAAYNAGSPRPGPAGGFENQAYVDKVLLARDAWAAKLRTQGGTA
jgi:soluble lytic murein transglycosylase-like protein